MKKIEKALKKADKLISSREYSKANKLLLSLLIKTDNNSMLFALLAKVELFLDKYDTSQNFTQSALILDPQNVKALLVSGYLLLAARDTQEALATYIKILEIEPDNKLAKKIIDKIKNIDDIDKFTSYLKPINYVIEKRHISKKVILIPTLLIAIPIIVFVSYKYIRPEIVKYLERASRDDISNELKNVYLFEGDKDIREDSSGEYSAKKISQLFDKTKKDIKDGSINNARISINTINLSSVNPYLKEKFLLLTNFISPPPYSEHRNNIEYSEVAGSYEKYYGTFVIWKVKVNSIAFDDGISYMTLGVVEDDSVVGIIKYTLEGEYELKRDDTIEIYGEIITYGNQSEIEEEDIVNSINRDDNRKYLILKGILFKRTLSK